MAGNDRNPGGSTGNVKSHVLNASGQDKRSPAKALEEARDELAQKASALAAESKEAAAKKAEDVQHGIGASLSSMAGALRAAGDHLAEKREGTASKLIGDTADGIERLASSLREKSLEEVIGEIRTFGRDNAAALIAGTALAGLALGRLARTSSLARSEGRSSPDAGQAASPPSRSHADAPSDGGRARLSGQEGQHHG